MSIEKIEMLFRESIQIYYPIADYNNYMPDSQCRSVNKLLAKETALSPSTNVAFYNLQTLEEYSIL